MTATLLTRPGPPVDDVTRRQLIGGAGAVGLLAVLPGCGSDSDDNAGSASSAAEVRISHKYGETEAPPDPKRIVSVGIREADPLLALGVVPIAVTDFYTGFGEFTLPWPWAREPQGDAQIEVLPEVPINFERIAALEPDLILGTSSGMESSDYDRLSQIAPTVAQSGEYPSYATPLEVELRTIARALGREAKALQLLGDLDARFAAARARHPEFTDAVIVELRGRYEGNIQFYNGIDREHLRRLGFASMPLTEQMEPMNAFYSISEERVDLIDHDLLIRYEYAEDDGLTDLPTYQRLDVVRAGRVVTIEGASPLSWALSFQSVLSLPYALEQLEPMLAEALAGSR